MTLRPYNRYVTDPPRTTGVSIRLRSIENPYPQRSIMHAEARDGPVRRNPTSLALRPSPTRRPIHAKLRLRALRVCSCTSKRSPRLIAATPNARRVGCNVCLEVPLLYINSLWNPAIQSVGHIQTIAAVPRLGESGCQGGRQTNAIVHLQL